jgi:hypothetical protein
VAFLVRGRSRSGLFAAAALLVAQGVLNPAYPAKAAASSTSSGFQIEKVGNQGIKLTSKNGEYGYAVTVLGSNAEWAVPNAPEAEAWKTSLAVQVEGNLGAYFKTNLSTHFTEVERSFDPGSLALQGAEGFRTDRRELEEFSLSTQFLGDRVSLSSSRRASSYMAFEPRLAARGGYGQDKFNAWVWRSKRSSLLIEGAATRIDSGFQTLGQAPQALNEESKQLKSKLTFGRAGVFVAQRDARALASDRGGVLSQQSEVETGASLGLADLRKGHLLALLPDSVWVSTNQGSLAKGDLAVSPISPVEKSAIGMTRNFGSSSVNLSYWRSGIEAPDALPDQSEWRGRGMDVGGTLKSGSLSTAVNLSWSSADNTAALNNTAESTLNGSLYLTWSRAAWPKLSAGVSNYAHSSAFFDYSGIEQNSMMRYDLAVDSSPLLARWSDPRAQLKFIASYQENSSRSQWKQTQETGAENLFFGFKFSRSILP